MDSELMKLLDPSLGCSGYAIEDSRIIFHVFSMKATQFCPYCGMASTKVHSTYIRNIEDIPIQERQTILRVKTRKMFCNNPECQHKTFSESFEFVEPKGRKTKRLLTRILKTSLSLSSINASSILKEEHVLVGKSTICQLIKKNANFDAE